MKMKQALIHSTWWGAAASGIDNAIQFLVFIILARMLPLPAIGLVALLISIVDLSRIFVYGGLPSAVVRAPLWDNELASTCFWFNIFFSVIVCFGIALIGGAVIDYYFYQGATYVVWAVSMILIIDAARAIHVAKIQREFKNKSLALRSLVAGVTAGAIAIFMAYKGLGVWALVSQRLVFAIVLTAFSWRAAEFFPSPVFRAHRLAEIRQYATHATLVRLLDILNLRLADLLVGWLFGPAVLGGYRVAARSVEAVLRLVARPLQDASFAVYSRLSGNRQSLSSSLGRVTRLFAAVMFPTFFGLAALAPEMIVLMFGARFQEYGTVMAVLTLASLPTALFFLVTAASMGAGDSRSAVLSNVIGVCVVFVGCSTMSVFGALGVAFGNLLGQSITLVYGIYSASKETQFTMRAFWQSLATPLIAAIAMYASLTGIKYFYLQKTADLESVVLLVLAGVAIYPVIFVGFDRGGAKEIVNELSGVWKRR